MTKEEKELRACYHWTEWERKAKELEKENAELKERLAETNLNGNIVLRELTKAKELLKKLYEETRDYMNDQGFDMNVINEVYDFIKSEVVE